VDFQHHFIKFETYARYFVLYNLGYIENRRAQVSLDFANSFENLAVY
jgi:hypothetical protein